MLFNIDSATGELTTAAGVDATIKTSYTLNVQATNSVSRVGKVALTVTVEDSCNAAAQLGAFIAVLIISVGVSHFM